MKPTLSVFSKAFIAASYASIDVSGLAFRNVL
jgi:hypothetical protein